MLFFLGCLISLGMSVSLHAQVNDNATAPQMDKTLEQKDQEGSQMAMMKVLKHSREKNYMKLANIMVYAGKDPNRQMKAMINYDDPHERLEVEHTANKLNYLMRKYETYEPQNYRTVGGMGYKLFLYDLVFTDKKGKAKTYKISFVKRNGNYYFANFAK